MGSLRSTCSPHAVFSSALGRRRRPLLAVSFQSRDLCRSGLAGLSGYLGLRRPERSGFPYRTVSRRTVVAGASNWTSEKSPYDTLELERDADDEKIKTVYRRRAKYYHPDGVDLMRRKAEAEKKKVISQLLAAEGLELEPEDEESRNRNFQS